MFRAIFRWTMLLAALLCLSAAAPAAQAQALLSWGADFDYQVSGMPTTGTYAAVAAGYEAVMAGRTNPGERRPVNGRA